MTFIKINSINKYNFKTGGTASSGDPFDLGGMAENLPANTGAVKKTPQSFLGENSALVNLDNLVSASTIKPTAPAPTGRISCALKTGNIEKERNSIFTINQN